MAIIEEVTMFRTTDEKAFKSVEEATEHQNALILRDKIDKIVGRFYFWDMRQEEIVDGLLENIDSLEEALKV